MLRDGQSLSIPSEEVVPGDIVQLSAGSLIPGDGLLVEAKDLFVTQALLTGETYPVEKKPGITAQSATLAEAAGIKVKRIITGGELLAMKDEALWHLAPKVTLFAEVDPNQKERIIIALQKTGHVVGYLGDGINDAPALHAADVGISVDQAVDVAKEAADFVLMEHDLEVLRQGIEEGRRTFANTLKYIFITTSANFGNMISMALASLFLPFLPLLAKQILLNNFLSDIPAIGIAGDNVDRDWERTPHRWDIKLIRNFMITFGLVSVVFDLLTFGVLLYFAGEAAEVFRTGWFFGLLLLAGLVLVVSHIGELEYFVHLIRRVEPAWLILALLLQFATYLSVAAVWYLALRSAGARHSLLPLIPLGVAKLFSDQAMPSGGMRGTAFFVAALSRRGIPNHQCMAALLLSLVAYYGAYLLAALTTALLLYFYHALHAWIVFAVSVFSLVAVGIPAGALWLRSLGKKILPGFFLRIPGLSNLMEAIANAPRELLDNRKLMLATIFLYGSVFVLDSATLWVMLEAVGTHVAFWTVFPSFVLASMVATIGPIPLGLGTFEVTCVSMLGAMGVAIEAALTATLLLRGFTLWLPMLPGMWLTRRALR